MKYFVCLFALTLGASAQNTCLIIKHASTAHQAFVSGANWQYVEGDFPQGMKWKSNITDRNVRKVKELGGKVITLRPDYALIDLEDARKACAPLPEKAEK
jgi:hypothetical protein